LRPEIQYCERTCSRKFALGEFQKLYSPLGRESIPPERLTRALLLQAFYSIRSERQLVERIDSDLLFRWLLSSEHFSVDGTLLEAWASRPMSKRAARCCAWQGSVQASH
jgi:transposase